MPTLLYQGHASLRLISDRSAVMYVDPFAGEGYDLSADIVLITHQHTDHNRLELVRQNPNCIVITEAQAQTNGVYNTFRPHRFTIQGFPASNDNHDPREAVGYLVTVDGVKLYIAGDTSETDSMGGLLFQRLDYAFLPIDGVHNMDPVHACICAARIGARHSIPYHMKQEKLFDNEMARRFDIPGRLILRPGQEIELKHR